MELNDSSTIALLNQSWLTYRVGAKRKLNVAGSNPGQVGLLKNEFFLKYQSGLKCRIPAFTAFTFILCENWLVIFCKLPSCMVLLAANFDAKICPWRTPHTHTHIQVERRKKLLWRKSSYLAGSGYLASTKFTVNGNFFCRRDNDVFCVMVLYFEKCVLLKN